MNTVVQLPTRGKGHPYNLKLEGSRGKYRTLGNTDFNYMKIRIRRVKYHALSKALEYREQ